MLGFLAYSYEKAPSLHQMSRMMAHLQRNHLVALAILVVIALAVRLPGVFSRAIWYDESITLLETAGHANPTWSESPTPAAAQKALLSGHPPISEIARGLRETDVHPPVYYVSLSLWQRVAGPSIESARLFSVAWSIVSVALLYQLLLAAGFAQPWAPSLVFALSSGAVHYAHESRNYSMAMCLVLAAALAAFLANKHSIDTKKFLLFSTCLAILSGLSFQTNYLSIFSIILILLWYVFWIQKERRIWAISAVMIAALITFLNLGTFKAQLGARPNQFQKELGFGEELAKIFDFNCTIIWNPVTSNIAIMITIFFSIVLLAIISFMYCRKNWKSIDKKLLTLIVGLAVAPSLGVLLLDLVFSKDLGKSSYVLFGGPALIVLLTMVFSGASSSGPFSSWRSAVGLRKAAGYLLALILGLQLTGINFGLERTPNFAGSTLRSTISRIQNSSSDPVIVVGAGHGRGDPACVVYEAAPETMISVVNDDTDIEALSAQLAGFEDVWLVFAKGRRTSDAEERLYSLLTDGGGYRAVSRATRLAHLKKTEPSRGGG